MIKVLLLLLTLPLMGCEEVPKAAASNHSKKVQDLALTLYELPPEPPPPPVVEVVAPVFVEAPILTPVVFPSTEPLLRENRAKILRGQRQASARRGRATDSHRDRYRISDPDYQQWAQPLPEDMSTFAVDRSRILTADMRIGAILEDNVNSQIPGRIIAIVDRDVLSPNGKFILLPAYTKIICGYQELTQTGETRLPVSCTRAIRPDGASISLTNASTSDQMGRTGLIGDVDNRTFERYGGAFIVSGISALAQSGVNQNQGCLNQGFGSNVNNAATSLANNLGQVTSEVIKQNIDLRPIITIPAGSRIQIIPQTDIVLRKALKEDVQ